VKSSLYNHGTSSGFENKGQSSLFKAGQFL